MNTLVLQPYPRRLEYAFFANGSRAPACAGASAVSTSDAGLVAGALDEILAACLHGPGEEVELVAVRAPFGGEEFAAPAMVTPETLRKLRPLAAEDPLHVPALLVFLECCGQAMPGTPIALAFETAFFVPLPAREHLYGLDPELTPDMGLRRYGYHGIYHEAACLAAAREAPQKPQAQAPRILSICLENRPEVAAVIGRQPVMVTSGATPLEGLPGQNTCGELDPGIVLMLAQKLHWGAEQINLALTRSSGWGALAGERVDLETLLTSRRPALELAREVVRYRMLVACGAGVAAMGGVDAIAFSGHYAGLADVLGPWLQSKLSTACRHAGGRLTWHVQREGLSRLIADTAASTLGACRARQSIGQTAGG